MITYTNNNNNNNKEEINISYQTFKRVVQLSILRSLAVLWPSPQVKPKYKG